MTWTRRGDVPQRLLEMMVGLLPAAQRDWGRAMSAELEGVVAQPDRWAFAFGCAAAVLRRPAVLKSLTYTVIAEVTVIGVLAWSLDLAAPLRWTVVAIGLALVGVSTLGRVPGALGPVAASGTARLARGVGHLIVAVVGIGFLAHFGEDDNLGDDARVAALFGGSALVCYLVGFVAATGDRAIATGPALRWGMASGIGAALAWPLMVAAIGHVPFDTGPALVMVTAAVVVAVWGTARQPAQAWIAAMFAGAIGTLSIVIELVVMAGYAPARMIPDLAPAALSAADDLAQSRAELEDPYVILFVMGALIALALGIASTVSRLPRLTAGVTTER